MGVGANVAGAVMQAGGTYGQAQGQRSALQYQASVARSNAALAGHQASDTIRAGQAAEGVQRMRTGQMVGAQRAQMAANGIDLGEGNATDILTTTKAMGERDALQINDNAMMQAWGYRTQQQSFLDESSRAEGQRGAISPWLSAATSLLGSASSVASGWDAKAKGNGTPDFGSTVKSKWSSMWGSK